MPFHMPINILDFIFKGMLIGLIVSAPMGPVGVLCVQRTLKKGRWYGFVTGVGAAASDIIYAAITGFGMAFVMDFVSNTRNRFYLQIIGSLMLLAFGWYTYRTDPTKKMHQSSQTKGTLTYNTVTAFLVTLSNPLIIFLFMALYAQFAFVLPDHPFEMNGSGIHEHRRRRIALVVGPYLAGGQDTPEVRREWHQDYQPGHWRGRHHRQHHHAFGNNHQPTKIFLIQELCL